MRAITIRQPWAWAVIHGSKDVENRSTNIAGPYRGLTAIHAGLALAPRVIEDGPLSDALSAAEANSGEKVDLFHGFVIGVVDLADVHHALRTTGPDEPTEMCSEWAQDGDLWHLILRNPRPLATPIPWRGRLGLWTVPADLEAAIREQVKP